MTFLGVYFITSGRVRADDESTLLSEDEEEVIGLLRSERHAGRVDSSAPGTQPKKAASKAQDRAERSPLGSLLSPGAEGSDDSQLTPRGTLSAAPSSPGGSFTAESTLSAPTSEQGPSPLRPPSRMSNPWAESHEPSVEITESDPRVHHSDTDPDRPSGTDPSSTVLLRFPPAPGLEEAGSSTAAARRASTPSQRPDRNIQTPSRNLRKSISTRFSPGPLLPTLSAGFSAVVAESLRRGENSSFRDHSKRKLARRKRLDSVFGDGAFYQDADSGPSAAESDGRFSPLTVANARLQSATSFTAAPAEAGHSTPALATDVYAAPTEHTDEEGTRVRSLSDSLSGAVAWVSGGVQNMHPDKSVESVAATHGSASGETHPSQSGNDGHRDADGETDAHSR